MPMTFKDVLLPATEAEFLAHLRSRRLLHVSAADPDRFAGLFSWGSVETIIARHQVPAGDVRLFMNGRLVALPTTNVLDEHAQIKPGALQFLARQGVSVVLNHLNGTSDALWHLTCCIERHLGYRISIATIASLSDATAMPLHYDHHDSLIVQVAGRKHWDFYGEIVPGSGRKGPLKQKPTEITAKVTMQQGDVMFIPAGLHHQCRPEVRSLHLAILLKRPTGHVVVDHLRDRIAQDLLFDELVPQGFGAEALAQYERGIKVRLLELVEALDVAGILALQAGQYPEVATLDLLIRRDIGRPGAQISLIPRGRIAIPPGGSVQAMGLSVPMTPAMRSALERLNDEGRIGVAGLLDALAVDHGRQAAAEALHALIDRGLVRLDGP
jgi:hypothetical protein